VTATCAPAHEIDYQAVVHLASRIFGDRRVEVQRSSEGVSTYVYRVHHDESTWYIRVLPEDGASFAPEVAAHQRLSALGVKVPKVIYFDNRDEALRRSVMVTSAVEGGPVLPTTAEGSARQVFIEAGRDLAILNSVPVEGFGWVRRDHGDVALLTGEHATHGALLLEHWRDDIEYLEEHVFNQRLIVRLADIVAELSEVSQADRATLAHGDFDTTHIFQMDDHYTGIIDFGEIRGTGPWYDPGHFHLHDGERLRFRALAPLLQGYGEVSPLPEDVISHVRLSALLIGVRALVRNLRKRPPGAYTTYLAKRIEVDVASFSE